MTLISSTACRRFLLEQLNDADRRLLDVEAERPGHALGAGGARAHGVDHHRAVADRPGPHAAEHDQRIGRGGVAAATTVGGRPRRGACALRTAAQQARLVDPGDRAAARADRMDVDRRQADMMAADAEAIDQLRASRLQHADVAARATDLHRDQVVATAKPAVVAHGADAGGRAGQAEHGRRP